MFTNISDVACLFGPQIKRLLNFSVIFLLVHPLIPDPGLYIIPGCKSIKPGKKVEKPINLKFRTPNFLKNPGKQCKGNSNHLDNNTLILFLIGIKRTRRRLILVKSKASTWQKGS